VGYGIGFRRGKAPVAWTGALFLIVEAGGKGYGIFKVFYEVILLLI